MPNPCIFNCTEIETWFRDVYLYVILIEVKSKLQGRRRTAIQAENLTSENTSLYREVLMKQYKDLKYDIVEENIEGDKATVKVKITVYDLHNSKVESENYMNEHQDEFMDADNLFDDIAYMKYRLEKMFEVKDTITHDIEFNLTKENDEWKINDIDRVTLEKIHGLYNYNN